MNIQANRIEYGNGALIQDERSFSIADVVDNLFYYRWQFIFTVIIVTSVALAYAITATPIYSADALIQVEEKKGTSLGALTQVATALGAQQSPILGEIEIIRSRSVIGRAVRNLKANVEVTVENRLPIVGNWLSRILSKDESGLTKPLWSSNNWAWGGELIAFEEFTVPPSLTGMPLTFTVGDDKKWTLATSSGTVIASGEGKNNLVVAMDGTLRIDIASLRARPGNRFRIVAYSIPSRVAQVLASLSVAETRRSSSILKITYEHPNASYATTMLNEIADVYLKQNVSRRSEEAELSLKFLNEELPKLRVQLDASERALNDFRSKTKTLDISSEIKELLAKATMIEKTQVELDLKRREYAERYDPSHPVMRSLLSQLAGIKAEYGELSKQIGRLPSVEQDYIRLARDVQVNNQLYVSLLNNAQQLQIAKAGTTGNVAIIDSAVVPERPARPKKAVIVAIGGLAGLVLGFAICQILALISKVVNDPKKLEQETNLPTLAILPLDSSQMEQAESGQADGVFLLAKELPGSPSVEALRSLRTALLFKLSEKSRSKVVLITSAVPWQGKSFISVNLSYLFAATGKKVLLIEADIRLASVKRYLNFDTKGPGLSTVLKDGISPERAIVRNVHPNLDFLPSGPTVRNPGDVLASDATHQLITELAELYDYVVIDSPPLLPVHDARSLAKSADVTLFIARQGGVNLSEIHDAIDVFNKSGNTIDGVVFNGFVPSSIRYGYGYSYRAYRKYSKYGRRYGTYSGYGRYGGSEGSYGGYGKSEPDK